MKTQNTPTIWTLTEEYEMKILSLNLTRNKTIDLMNASSVLAKAQLKISNELYERYME